MGGYRDSVGRCPAEGEREGEERERKRSRGGGVTAAAPRGSRPWRSAARPRRRARLNLAVRDGAGPNK